MGSGGAQPPATTMSEAAPSLLEVRDVSVRFGGVNALSGVDLSIQAGQVRGLIGPNGAGKTTLFDVITGVRTPSAGRVLLAGDDVTRRNAVWLARRGVRRTFQRQQPFGWLSVEDNVLAAIEWRGGGGGIVADLISLPNRVRREKSRRAEVEHVLQLCGLTGIRHEFAGRLSIGQARMVELARAVVDTPTLLLLDEPTSGLEEPEVARLGQIIQELRTSTNCAVLLVEHYVRFVMDQCDRVTVLNLGEVIGEGAPAEVSSDRSVRAAYLG